MTKPTLFLDIDGVLHPVSAAFLMPDNSAGGTNLFRWLPKLKEALSRFPDVQVVLHSTWRIIWETDEELYKNIPVDLKEMLVATTGREEMGRYNSIIAYAAKHNITKYVILDDDSPAFPHKLAQLVPCKSQHGIARTSTMTTLIKKLAEISEYGKTKEELDDEYRKKANDIG